MMELFKCVKGCKGGKYQPGQIVNVDQNIDYNEWQYIFDKVREGAFIPYVPPVIKVKGA